MIEFTPFPSIARLSRHAIISEKIDGTNASVLITEGDSHPQAICGWEGVGVNLLMFAGSRTKFITPGKGTDNAGFARWVVDHQEELKTLGVGAHFGEWWGSGIQRGYNLTKGEKRWSLFNTDRWCLHGEEPTARYSNNQDPAYTPKLKEVLPPCCGLVPVLYSGVFSDLAANASLALLEQHGSQASPGFMNPEGIVVYHVAADQLFKKTLGGDGHKTLEAVTKQPENKEATIVPFTRDEPPTNEAA